MRNQKTWYGPKPPAELTSCEPSLLSQGAEARVWLVTLPRYTSETAGDEEAKLPKANISVGSGINVPKLNSLSQIPFISQGATQTICKERFPKKYRHPQLDISLTKNRTKAEARCLIRCQRANVPCPNVLAIAQWSSDGIKDENIASPAVNGSATAFCLFLEHIDGCTVRHYFEEKSNPSPGQNASQPSEEPEVKKARVEIGIDGDEKPEDRIITKVDTQTLLVAHTLGSLVAKMHAAGIIHGDLTTSNVMLRNFTSATSDSGGYWKPELVLIDFGLATSTAAVQINNNAVKGNKNKQQNNAEEKAVDLYVLERAFLSTHPESELLVEEVWKGYLSYYEGLDNNNGISDNAVGPFMHVAKSVMNRLDQVRMRGRKRECFG